MRAREVCHDDAYSFHADYSSLEQTYRAMHDTIARFSSAWDSNFVRVSADTGAIGGSVRMSFTYWPHEVEMHWRYCPASDLRRKCRAAEAVAPTTPRLIAT